MMRVEGEIGCLDGVSQSARASTYAPRVQWYFLYPDRSTQRRRVYHQLHEAASRLARVMWACIA